MEDCRDGGEGNASWKGCRLHIQGFLPVLAPSEEPMAGVQVLLHGGRVKKLAYSQLKMLVKTTRDLVF